MKDSSESNLIYIQLSLSYEKTHSRNNNENGYEKKDKLLKTRFDRIGDKKNHSFLPQHEIEKKKIERAK